MYRFYLLTLFLFSFRSGFAQNLFKPETAFKFLVFSACETTDSVLWFATGDGYGQGGVVMEKGSEVKFFTTDDGLPVATYQKVMVATDGSIWVGGISSQQSNAIVLANYRHSKWTTWSIKNYSAFPVINKICEIPKNEIWVATFGGILQKNDTGWTTIGENYGLPDIKINDILVDRDSRIWIATESGICQYSEGRFHGFEDAYIIPEATILYEDTRNYIWAGGKFDNQGISVYDGLKWHTYTMNDGLVDNCVGTIVEDYLGRMWFGGYYDNQSGGITMLNNGQFHTYSFPEIGKYSVDCLLADRFGGIWCGGSLKERSRLGLSYYKLGKWHKFGMKEGITNDRVFYLFEDAEGTLWVSTIKGVFTGDINLINKSLTN